jgi:hypothetical protein
MAGLEIRSYLFLFIGKVINVNFDWIIASEDTHLTLLLHLNLEYFFHDTG